MSSTPTSARESILALTRKHHFSGSSLVQLGLPNIFEVCGTSGGDDGAVIAAASRIRSQLFAAGEG